MERVRREDREYNEVTSGVYLADLAAGEQAGMKYWRIESGETLPTHRHANEQIGFVISGRLIAILDEREVTLEPGDSYVFRSGELHGAENRSEEPAVGIGVLSPPRASPDWGTCEVTAGDRGRSERAESDD